MENNKTLFVASQYKRKGFLYFLCATFLLHLSYFVYIEHSAPRIDLVIEKLPEELVTIKKPIASELAPSSLKQLEKGTKALKIKTVRSVLDVNKATALDFQKVYGIGPVYSKRIVKFRAIFWGGCTYGPIAASIWFRHYCSKSIKSIVFSSRNAGYTENLSQ